MLVSRFKRNEKSSAGKTSSLIIRELDAPHSQILLAPAMIVPELTDRLPRPQRQSSTLACVEFSSTPSTDSPALIHTGLPPVDDIPLYETWPSSVESPETGNDSGWSYRHDGQNLFAWSYLSEADNIEDQTKQKYRSLLSLLDALRFPYLVKVWHYIPGCLLYTSPSPRDRQKSRMPSSA